MDHSFKCPICPKTFKTEKVTKDHIRVCNLQIELKQDLPAYFGDDCIMVHSSEERNLVPIKLNTSTSSGASVITWPKTETSLHSTDPLDPLRLDMSYSDTVKTTPTPVPWETSNTHSEKPKYYDDPPFKYKCLSCSKEFLNNKKRDVHYSICKLKSDSNAAKSDTDSCSSSEDYPAVNKKRKMIVSNKCQRPCTIEWECDKCGKLFPTLSLFQTHSEITNCLEAEKYRCSICSKEFDTEKGRKVHYSLCKLKSDKNDKVDKGSQKLVQSIKYESKCKKCGIYFLNSEKLQDHWDRLHRVSYQSNYACCICSEEFASCDSKYRRDVHFRVCNRKSSLNEATDSKQMAETIEIPGKDEDFTASDIFVGKSEPDDSYYNYNFDNIPLMQTKDQNPSAQADPLIDVDLDQFSALKSETLIIVERETNNEFLDEIEEPHPIC